MVKFLKREDGLVTIEWVGIAAVMVLAAIAITGFVMQGADVAGGTTSATLQSNAATEVEGPGGFGDGTID